MRQQTLLSSLVLSTILSANLCADDECCGMSPRPMRMTARHIEANGVGYNQGYTTLEGFFSPNDLCYDDWIPFLDLRAHVFNSGKWAANAGLGARYINSSRVWGGNIYYDYRDTNHQHYNQVGLGFESLGEVWDFRANGYLPVGMTRSPFYKPRFAQFEGHSLVISRKIEFAMRGVNAEVGAHVKNCQDIPLYFAAGPYYLGGRGKNAWGGELRATVDIGNYLRLEGNTSYDSVFHWIGQGQVSLMVPFGAKRAVRKHCNCCPTALALSQRALQRVDRNEIIAVDDKHKLTRLSSPFFIFVDSNSHSDGTWESPYPTLILAQDNSGPNDVIYVLPGNGSPYDVTSSGGFTMQEGQKLWGSSVSHPLDTPYGAITIPALSKAMPSVLNTDPTPGSFVIAMPVLSAEVVGMGIQGGGVASLGIFYISGSGNGTLLVQDNQISDLTVAGVAVDNNGANITATISNNQISNISTNSMGADTFVAGVIVEGAGGSSIVNISDNQISNMTSLSAGIAAGIAVTNFGTSVCTVTLQNNQISSIIGMGTAEADGITARNNNAGNAVFSFLDNQVSGVSSLVTSHGILAPTSIGTTGPTCVTLIGNNTAPSEILLEKGGSGPLTLNSTSGNNTPTPTESGGVTNGSCP